MTATPSRRKKGSRCARGWSVRRGSLLQDGLPMQFQDVKFKDPTFKHQIFVRMDIKHSYFSNYFIICLQSIFSVVEIIIELFVVCQKLIHVYATTRSRNALLVE